MPLYVIVMESETEPVVQVIPIQPRQPGGQQPQQPGGGQQPQQPEQGQGQTQGQGQGQRADVPFPQQGQR